jgi:hemerythrin
VPEQGVNSKLTSGSFAGELSGIMGDAARGTYRALSHVRALAIPQHLYVEFLNRHRFLETIQGDIRKRRDLQGTWIFGERLSCPLKHRIATAMTLEACPRGWEPPPDAEPALYLLQDGAVAIASAQAAVETLAPGDFFGEDRVLFGGKRWYAARATTDSRVYRIPPTVLEGIPIVHWKLFETFERRANALESGRGIR